MHSSTASHFDVVSTLLNAGVHVCVDKPLAENLRDAERLVELAARKKLTLMVGFNRRFAPLYGELKTQLATAASLRMDKDRVARRYCYDVYPFLDGNGLYTTTNKMQALNFAEKVTNRRETGEITVSVYNRPCPTKQRCCIPLSCAGQTCPEKTGGWTNTGGFTSTIPSTR